MRCYFIRPHRLRIWFLCVRSDTVVWLTSVPASPLTTLPLTQLPDTTPALPGLSPFGTPKFMGYIHHARNTQAINHMALRSYLPNLSDTPHSSAGEKLTS
ncbi:MAG: hypothetical protein AAF600_21355 [Bacteroidota bacterium]